MGVPPNRSPGQTLGFDDHLRSGEPVIFKDGAFVAPLLLGLNAIAPAVISALSLYGFTLLYGVPFNRPFAVLTVLAAVLALVMLQPQRNVVSQLLTPRLSMAVDMGVRWGIMLAVLLAIGYLTRYSNEYSRRVLASWALVTPMALMGVSLALQDMVRRLMGSPELTRRVVFAGCNELSCTLAQRMRLHPELCMSVSGFFDDRSRARLDVHGRIRVLGKLDELADYVTAHEVDAIYVALPMRDMFRVQEVLRRLQDTTASVYYLPDVPLGSDGIAVAPIQTRSCELLGMPVVALCETPYYGLRGVIKRLMDMTLSALLLAALSPVLVAVALAVKYSSPGPIIFQQRRYGVNGQPIGVYKFRTMTVAEDGEQVRQATRNDSRVTPVGRFLRRYSLDELPQLLNVLQGRMSLVGPRPHAVAHNEEYRKLVRGYMIRHKVLPGITGLAQINGCRGEISNVGDLQARLQFDLDYLRHWSPLLDIKIMFRTAVTIFGDEKAY